MRGARKNRAGDFEEGDAIELDALAAGRLYVKKAAQPMKKGKGVASLFTYLSPFSLEMGSLS